MATYSDVSSTPIAVPVEARGIEQTVWRIDPARSSVEFEVPGRGLPRSRAGSTATTARSTCAASRRSS